MKSLLILLCLGLLLAVSLVKCQERRGRQRDASRAAADMDIMTAEETEEEEEEEDEIDEVDIEAVEAAQNAQSRKSTPNPCLKKKCRRGEMCKLENMKPVCVCDTRCEEEVDRRYWVCSTKNVSFPSECHLDSEHCRCKRRDPACQNRALRKVDLDYYGECISITPCPKEEFQEFPSRLRDWFFIVMKQLAQRKQLGEYLELLRTARNDQNHTDATIWKFCDLDTHPQDRQVSRRELQYTVRSLKAYEHCLMPFLNFCDTDKNRKITLEEWGTCLGVSRQHITNKCKEIHAKAKRRRN